MSTHSFISTRRRLGGPAAFSALAGLLVALLMSMLLCSTALASPRQPLSDPPQSLARSGVSVVRLLVFYADAKTHRPSIACTGLGSLIASWPSQGSSQGSSEQNNWVVTDGNLVTTGTTASCAPGKPAASLSSIDIFMSSAYNTQLTFEVASPTIHCSTSPQPCSNGMAVFAFNTDAAHTQPHLDLAASDTAQAGGIGLSKNATSLETPVAFNPDAQHISQYQQAIQQHLTPVLLPLKPAAATGEAGMPLVNSAGELIGITLSHGTTSVSQIRTFLASVPELKTPHTNPLHDSWNTGIMNYYSGHYPAALSAFQSAFQANPQFLAAQTFAQLATTRASVQGKSGTTSSGSHVSPTGSLKFDHYSIPYWLLGIAALIVLAILLVLVSLIFGRSRAKRRREQELREEFAEAERKAEIEAQRIKQMEADQQRQQQAWAQQTLPITSEKPLVDASVPSPQAQVQELYCPRCRMPVQRGANYCSHCRLLLSPSESGLHLRVSQPASEPPTSVVPAGSIPDQPTLDMVVTNDQPTLPIWPGSPTNGQGGQAGPEVTVPFGVQQVTGRRLGLAVGAGSDPGIKRKYKPNEDSLFAAQGARKINSSSLPFGLFVVADGMGGHANGQDASRRAIQTIIDFMLPKLVKNTDWSKDALSKLLTEGVQQANQAVHQNNMELRADMGTTVTAALVVGTTAFVSNVGDSRTYLYREGEGLKKITTDHSVVASLVEAGIIKPDDIYTHPKRNQIYRSLGEKPLVEVDSFTVQLRPGDKLLLCSDGLWDMVRDPQIEDVIKQSVPDPNMTVDALIKAALEGGGEDNVSVIVVSVDEMKQQLAPGFQLLAKPEGVQMPQM